MSISISDNSTQTLAETHEQDANKGVSDPPPDFQSSKKADLAGPGIGDYNELEKILPRDYNPRLNAKETQQAVFQVKRYIEDNLCKELSLMMVEVPLIVDAESGVNDMLDRDGSRTPIQFHISNDRDKHPIDAQVVQAATKWKRMALKQFECRPGEGICTDMRAVRKDYFLDHDHSAYVDQWDWERVITAEQRNLEFLKSVVRKIWKVLVGAEKFAQNMFPDLRRPRDPNLPEELTFIHAEELLAMYPDLPRKRRETVILQKYPAIFVSRPFCSRLKFDYGVACASANAFLTACNSFSTPRILVDSSAFAPSDFASFGLSWTSMNTPSTPAATAARANNGMNSGWPPLVAGPFSSDCDEGNCTEWVASNTTGANFRIIASDRISTTRLLYPKLAPRSVKKTWVLPASRHFSTACRISHGELNCPFLMFTGRPLKAAATTRSVCRLRKAGICNTSATSATLPTSAVSCTSVRTGN